MSRTNKHYLWLFFTLFILHLFACQTIDEVLDVKPDGYDVVPGVPGKVRFVAVGDTGKGNSNQLKVARAIKTKCENDGCDFVLLLGDNFYDSGVDSINDSQFQTKFEDPYRDITLPFYVVLGNHDYGGDGAGYEIQKSIYQVQYTKRSDKWIMPAHYYKFNAGNTTFFALDTNAQLFNLANEQSKDVARWINQSQSSWNIVFGHHPYKSNGPHGNAGSYDGIPDNLDLVGGKRVKEFAESVWCGKADLYLAAHDHSRQWLENTCEGTSLVISGAGASTTSLPGNNPTLFQSDTPGILYVVINRNTLTTEFIDENGNSDFTHTLTKPQFKSP